MIRALVIFALLVAAAAGATWLADHPGTVTILWHGYRIDTSFAVLAIAAAAALLVTALTVRVLAATANALRLSRRARAERRRRRGYRALTRGMVAVAAGDAEEAGRQARRADSLLGEPPLTLLLSAQAAQLGGDGAAARKYFTAMLKRPETAFLGIRGLLNQALGEGDTERALALAGRAYELKPRTPWVVQTLFDLQARAGRWDAAAQTLHGAARHKVIAPAESRRRQAVALYGQSLGQEAKGRPAEALAAMRKAHRLAPDLVPVTARLALLLAAAGQERRAEKVLQRAWGRGPHPDLVRAHGELRPGEAPLERIRRLERLVSPDPEHEESHLALAEAALAADLWGEARRHLDIVLKRGGPGAPRRRFFRLMAQIEERERGDGEAARIWLARAAEADPDPVWVCRRCGAAAIAWSPICLHCDSFDSFTWGDGFARGPPRDIGAAATGQDGTAIGQDTAPGIEPPTGKAAPPLPARARRQTGSPAALTPRGRAPGGVDATGSEE